MEHLVMASKVASDIGAVAGAMIVKAAEIRFLRLPESSGVGWKKRCPKCSGTGKMECLCSRWSDGDRGCRTCRGSGRMACNNCRGSGSGSCKFAPIRVSVRSGRPTF
ncbi:hypothetical protein KSP40_PGU020880 [Platanthera guangdongensis]|uniref:Uncharacterized protein n=1 Tax=Platanthera guangdongensis TaxID=2320717 RepID=A0ABR2LL85_9ASPA